MRHGNADSCWKTIPTAGSVPSTGLPAIVISPAVGSISPPTISISVLLPQPLGPTIETNSPSSTLERDVAHRLDRRRRSCSACSTLSSTTLPPGSVIRWSGGTKSWTTSRFQSISWPPRQQVDQPHLLGDGLQRLGAVEADDPVLVGVDGLQRLLRAGLGSISASLAHTSATRSGLRLRNSSASARASSVFSTSARSFSSTPGAGDDHRRQELGHVVGGLEHRLPALLLDLLGVDGLEDRGGVDVAVLERGQALGEPAHRARLDVVDADAGALEREREQALRDRARARVADLLALEVLDRVQRPRPGASPRTCPCWTRRRRRRSGCPRRP